MGSVFYRVDDRLIHGQVMTAWSRYYQLKQVMIVDDSVAQDPVQQQIITVVAPPDMTVRVCSVEEAPPYIQEAEQSALPTLVLVKGPESLLGLTNENVNIPEVILGGMQFKPGRKKVTRTVAVTDEESRMFYSLSEAGVKLTLQVIPTDRPQNFIEALQRVFPEKEA